MNSHLNREAVRIMMSSQINENQFPAGEFSFIRKMLRRQPRANDYSTILPFCVRGAPRATALFSRVGSAISAVCDRLSELTTLHQDLSFSAIYLFCIEHEFVHGAA